PGAADRLWRQALNALDGRIDVLVNNAGVFEGVSIEAPDAAWRQAWDRALNINLRAAADLSRNAVSQWRGQGRGGR
ncbi:MAG TPA: SDR family NAD(P)-dependent oxidoreductase, partial [Phenylobacterium sp.]|nr:SDR family NAD(P)-dependent oxidoreductase [Phenylobacterium sp.]